MEIFTSTETIVCTVSCIKIFICQSDLRLFVIAAEINSEIIRIKNVQNSKMDGKFEFIKVYKGYDGDDFFI